MYKDLCASAFGLVSKMKAVKKDDLQLQNARHCKRWRRVDWLLVGCSGVLAVTHLASIIVLAILGSAPAHFYSEAAFFAAWVLFMVCV